jgi:hypothetical protein
VFPALFRPSKRLRAVVWWVPIAVVAFLAVSLSIPVGGGGPQRVEQRSLATAPDPVPSLGLSLGLHPPANVRATDPALQTQYTLALENGTLMAGDQVLGGASGDPYYVAYDPLIDQLYLSVDCTVLVVDPSTLTVVGELTAAEGCGVLYLPTTGFLYLSSPSYVTIVNPSDDSVVSRIYADQAGQTVYGLFVYDGRANAILVGNVFNETANVVNLTLGRVVANVSTGDYVDDGAYDPVNSNLYLNDYENNTVEEVNSSTWATTFLQLPTDIFGFLEGVAVDDRTGNVYATSTFYCPGCYGTDYLVELSGKNGSVLASRGLGTYTTGLAYDGRTNQLFVADSIRESVYAVDPDNLSRATTIKANAPGEGIYGSWWLVYVPPLNTIYAPTSDQGSLLAISDQNLSVYLQLGGLARPTSAAWDGSCGCLVVGDSLLNRLYLVNATTYRIMRMVPLSGSPRGMAYDPSTGQLWVGMGFLTGASGVAVLDGSNGTPAATLASGTWADAPAFDAADQRMFVPAPLSNVVDVYNSTNLSLVTKVAVSDATHAVWDPSDDEVFVSDWSADNVTVLAGASGQIQKTITGVPGPDPIVFDATTSQVYTGDQNSPEITVIDPESDTVVGNLSYPPYATDLALSPTGSELCVTGEGSNVSVVDLSTNLSTSIAAGSATDAMAWLPSGALAVTDLHGAVYFLSSGGPYPLTTPAVSIQPSVVPLGSPVTITTTVSGGTGSYSFVYAGLPSGCSSSDAPSVACTPDAGGQYEVEVLVEDAAGDRSTGTATLWVSTPYSVTFTEQGLPGGTSWSVTLGAASFSSISDAITFGVPSGTYSYAIGGVVGWDQATLPTSGTVTVGTSNVTEPTMEFLPIQYAVTFTETGLPTGTLWSVYLTGDQFSSSTDIISCAEPSGNYSYTVATTDASYQASGGTLTVHGAEAHVPVAFSLVTYVVTFQVWGLPSGSLWFVNITGQASLSSTGLMITTSLSNGTYSYEAASVVKGLTASGGSFSLRGPGTVKAVVFSPASSGGSSGGASVLGLPALEGYAVIGGIVAAAVLGTAASFLLRRRRRSLGGPPRPPGTF